MGTRKKKTGPQDVQEKRDSPPMRSLREILQQGLEAPVHREEAWLQPEYMLLRFQPRAVTSQWLDTHPK
jgi:hypothetical protein